MKRFLVTLGLIGLVTLLCTLSFATDYIVTNDDDYRSANSATVFRVGANGELTEVMKLSTGGTGLGGGYFAWTGVAVAQNEKCLFVANTGSDTISAFQIPSFKETGSYGISGMFSTYGEGGSIALHPSGKLLVSADSGLLNIATWRVGSNCALTLLNQYTPKLGQDYFALAAFTPNGNYVVVPSDDYGCVELYSVGGNGALKDLGYINFFNSISECSSVACFPTGMDFTADSKMVLFGNATFNEPSALSASITPSGLTNGQLWNLTNGPYVNNVNVPRFTKTARSGSGILLFGASGYSDAQLSGIICTEFTESPLNITVESATVLGNENEEDFQGSVATFGSEGWATEYPSTIQSFSISSECGITPGPGTNDPNSAPNLLSIVGYPANQ